MIFHLARHEVELVNEVGGKVNGVHHSARQEETPPGDSDHVSALLVFDDVK